MRASGDNQGLRFHASVLLITQGKPLGIINAVRKAGELLAHVEADLNAFTEGAPQQDDVTFLVLTGD